MKEIKAYKTLGRLFENELDARDFEKKYLEERSKFKIGQTVYFITPRRQIGKSIITKQHLVPYIGMMGGDKFYNIGGYNDQIKEDDLFGSFNDVMSYITEFVKE